MCSPDNAAAFTGENNSSSEHGDIDNPCGAWESACFLCPRMCGAQRSVKPGVCGADEHMRVAKIMLHEWEEPCLCAASGTTGNFSGAVFFSGCPLSCVYCQNRQISRRALLGELYSPEKLCTALLELQERGASNIDFITPTHYTPLILKALDMAKSRLHIPVVWNTSGYERRESLRALSGYVDIFLTDFKYSTAALAAKYSRALDYPEVAAKALDEMLKITGPPVFFDDTGDFDANLATRQLRRGVIIRLLVLPGHRDEAAGVLDMCARQAPDVILSLMSQYTPRFYDGPVKCLCRRVTTFEYETVREHALKLNFRGYSQLLSSVESALVYE